MSAPEITTPAELDAQLALEAMPTVDLLKRLAAITEEERSFSQTLNALKAAGDRIEAIVLQRMLSDDTPSITVTTDRGVKMRFSITSKTFPKMVNGSLVASNALQRYAVRLQDEDRYEEAEAILEMLTIKGQSLAPMLNEWLLEDMALPPEFDGAIEASTRFSLSKRKA